MDLGDGPPKVELDSMIQLACSGNKSITDDLELIAERGETNSANLLTYADNMIYHTTLPWISFTSFAHARTKGRGEFDPENCFRQVHQRRLMLPIFVEVHHAPMDGLDDHARLDAAQHCIRSGDADD
jgi:chloramphenicol O-acetyltransferase